VKAVYLLRHPGIANRSPDGWRSAVISAGPNGGYSEEDMREVSDADAFVVGLEPIGEPLLAAAPRLRLIQRLGVGYSNIDVAAAARRGIPVCNMPDFNSTTVAEHALMMILALLRRLFDSTLLMKAGRWPVDAVAADLHELAGKTVGIVGYGAIGRAVAWRVRAFGGTVLWHDRRPDSGRDDDESERADLEELLRRSDVVTLHVPLTAESRGLIGRRELGSMKPSAILINTARGAVVDEAALADALNEGAIAGAGLDVFSEEPPAPGSPLLRARNVLLTPHTAGQTREAMERMVAAMVANLERVARGEEPLYEVALADLTEGTAAEL
jgi:phosphoglycerate dehydrogenase-like enzyme